MASPSLPVDRFPSHRLDELSDLADSARVRASIERARPILHAVTANTGRIPALFLDENGQLEARWRVYIRRQGTTKMVNLTISAGNDCDEIYVYDRSTGEVVHVSTLDQGDSDVSERIVAIIDEAAVPDRMKEAAQ